MALSTGTLAQYANAYQSARKGFPSKFPKLLLCFRKALKYSFKNRSRSSKTFFLCSPFCCNGTSRKCLRY